jgi:hypothetical protein
MGIRLRITAIDIAVFLTSMSAVIRGSFSPMLRIEPRV